MGNRFPNASVEELRRAEMCIVCREEMTEGRKFQGIFVLRVKFCYPRWEGGEKNVSRGS